VSPKRKKKNRISARKRIKARANAKREKNTGVPLEKAVARIQQMLDPNSKVTHNEILADRSGNKRQYDVVIRGHFGGLPLLGVAECKDHAHKIGPAEVEAFAKKCENLGANPRIMFSRMGFTDQALQLARHEHIACLSLLPNDTHQGGYPFEATAFAKFWRWESMDMVLTPQNPDVVLPAYEVPHVLYEGKQVAAWFLNELLTTYKNHHDIEPIVLRISFDLPRQIEVAGATFEIASVAFRATRTFSLKRKALRLFGDGVYNWLDSTFQVPQGSQVAAGPFDGGFHDWEEFAEPIPDKPEGFFSMVLEVHDNQAEPKGDVIDLTVL
jgi:hypothetical protein